MLTTPPVAALHKSSTPGPQSDTTQTGQFGSNTWPNSPPHPQNNRSVRSGRIYIEIRSMFGELWSELAGFAGSDSFRQARRNNVRRPSGVTLCSAPPSASQQEAANRRLPEECQQHHAGKSKPGPRCGIEGRFGRSHRLRTGSFSLNHAFAAVHRRRGKLVGELRIPKTLWRLRL